MSALVGKLFGNGHLPEEVQGELRTILLQMRNERNAFEKLATDAQTTMEQASKPMDAVAQSVSQLEERLRAIEQIAAKAAGLEAQQRDMTTRLSEAGRQAEGIEAALDPIRSDLEQTKHLLQNSASLRSELEPLLEMGSQLQSLRSDVSALRDELREAQESMATVREQHEAVAQGGTDAVEQLSSLEDRYQEIAIGLQAAEQRATQLQGTMDSVSRLAAEVPDVRRELGTLKALRDYVAQKISELEQQRETVDYATSQGTRLAELVRRIDRDLEAQQESAKFVVKLEEDVARMRTAHKELSGQFEEIDAHTREAAQADEIRRQEFAALQELMDGKIRDAISRFEFEQERLNTASTQVADLRQALGEMESRFASVQEAQDAFAELRANLGQVTDRVVSMAMDLAPLDAYAERMVTVKSDIDRAEQSTKEIARRTAELHEAMASVDGMLAELQELSERTERQTRDLTQMRDYVAHFEQRVAKCEAAESAVSQAIDDAARRQSTVDALRADFQRMLQVAQETSDAVRVITESQDEISDGRRLVDDVLSEIRTVREESERLESRREGVAGIDEQIARAEALMIDIRTSLETLHEQKVFLDQVLETAGSLRFQGKQAEALIQDLRDARMRVQAANG
jgi:chromosome segregation ATPase